MRSIDDLEVQGKRVLVRVDFNVPLGADGWVWLWPWPLPPLNPTTHAVATAMPVKPNSVTATAPTTVDVLMGRLTAA